MNINYNKSRNGNGYVITLFVRNIAINFKRDYLTTHGKFKRNTYILLKTHTFYKDIFNSVLTTNRLLALSFIMIALILIEFVVYNFSNQMGISVLNVSCY